MSSNINIGEVSIVCLGGTKQRNQHSLAFAQVLHFVVEMVITDVEYG